MRLSVVGDLELLDGDTVFKVSRLQLDGIVGVFSFVGMLESSLPIGRQGSVAQGLANLDGIFVGNADPEASVGSMALGSSGWRPQGGGLGHGLGLGIVEAIRVDEKVVDGKGFGVVLHPKLATTLPQGCHVHFRHNVVGKGLKGPLDHFVG